MTDSKLLITANTLLFLCLLGLLTSSVMAYGFESDFSIPILISLHIAQIVLAGFIKLTYVFRLIVQQRLGILAG